MKALNDQELMRIVQSGDNSPASELYDRYSARIYNYALRFLRDSAAAEDVTHEVFMKMMTRAHQFNLEANLGTWLLTITANTCRDHWRKSENKVPKGTEEELVAIPVPEHETPHHLAEAKSTEARVKRALLQLPPDMREVIIFAKFRGMSYAEIARIVECSEMAVKTRVFRAMEMLKRKLVDEAGGGEECLTAS